MYVMIMKNYSQNYCISKEEKIIFLLSRLNPSSDVIESVNSLVKNNNDSIDFHKIKSLAFSNGAASLIYQNLKRLDFIPQDIIKSFRDAYLMTIKYNALNSREMVGILTLFRQNKINAIPLKGSIASEIIFGDLGLYPSSDIDILVHPADMKRAEKVLIEAGYLKSQGVSERDLLSSHYHLIFQKETHTVEVHWNLVKRYFYIPPEFWWEDIWQTVYEGVEVSMLSHERYLMYSIFRLFDHGFRPLKFFVLISEIISKYKNDIDWQKLLIFSKQYKMERLLLFTLRLLNDMSGTDIPENMLNRTVRGYELFKRLIISGLFNEIKRPHFRMFIYTFLLDSPQDFAKNLIRRIFPESSEIRLRYGVSEKSGKVYVYYLLNPLLIFFKKRSYH
jgi:hypothetical protein